MLNRQEKPKAKVFAGSSLTSEQIVDYQAQWAYQILSKLDTDEVLKKAGKSRADLSGLLYDDEIEQAIDRRKQTLKTTKYTLTPSDGAVARFVFDELNVHLPAILNASIDSKMYGYDVAEMIWDLSGQYRRVRSIVSKPIEWFEITNHDVLYYPNNTLTPIVISNQDNFIYKYLISIHEPTYKNPKGKALLSRVYWLWYFKTNGWRFWSKYLERFGSPLIIGKSDAQTQDDMTKFASVLLSAHNSGVIAVGNGDDVQIAQPSDTGNAFMLYDTAVKKRITIYLLGQTLTSGTDNGGTYGQGKIHQAQQEIIFNSDREHARTSVQRFIDIICHTNGMQAPRFEWISDVGLQQERASRDLVLHHQGVRFTKSYYADMYDLEDEHFWLDDNHTSKNYTPRASFLNNTAQAQTQAGSMAFTKQQQGLETIADELLANKSLPIPKDKLVMCIQQANNPTHLFELLADTVGHDLDNNAFAKLLSQSLALAAARGYVDSEIGDD